MSSPDNPFQRQPTGYVPVLPYADMAAIVREYAQKAPKGIERQLDEMIDALDYMAAKIAEGVIRDSATERTSLLRSAYHSDNAILDAMEGWSTEDRDFLGMLGAILGRAEEELRGYDPEGTNHEWVRGAALKELRYVLHPDEERLADLREQDRLAAPRRAVTKAAEAIIKAVQQQAPEPG